MRVLIDWRRSLAALTLGVAVLSLVACSGLGAQSKEIFRQCVGWDEKCAAAVIVGLERSLAKEWLSVVSTVPASREVCELAANCWENHVARFEGSGRPKDDPRALRIRNNSRRAQFLLGMESEGSGVLGKSCQELGEGVHAYQQVRVQLTSKELHGEVGAAIKSLLHRSRELYRRWD